MLKTIEDHDILFRDVAFLCYNLTQLDNIIILFEAD